MSFRVNDLEFNSMPPNLFPPPVPKIPGSREKWTFDKVTWKWRMFTQIELDYRKALKELNKEFPGYINDQ